MAAPVTRSKSDDKAAAKKPARPPRSRTEPTLQVRYWKVMKPQRVYGLVVSLPAGANDGVRGGSTLVIRPVIPGAQVVPAEQRFVMDPGNQITFQVTPLARGRLPRARLEVFAPGQPPEIIPTPMRAKTHRLALILLFLAWAIPTFLISWLSGDSRPLGSETFVSIREAEKVLAQREEEVDLRKKKLKEAENLPVGPGRAQVILEADALHKKALKEYNEAAKEQRGAVKQYERLEAAFKRPMKEYLPAIPIFNRPVGSSEEDRESKEKKDPFTVADRAGDYLAWSYDRLHDFRRDNPWLPNVIGAGFLFLAFVAWMWNDPRRKRLRHSL